MNSKDRLILWLAGLFALGAFLYATSSILLPFVVAMITAYFLNPVADKIEKTGLSRPLAATIITLSFFIIVITLTALLAPVFYNQFLSLLDSIPEYTAYINENIMPKFTKFLERINPGAIEEAKTAASGLSGQILSFLGNLAGNIWNSGLAIINIFSLLFVTPIVTFYALRDWHKIIAKIDNWLPKKHIKTIRGQAGEIDRTLSGYIRGQINVCLLFGAFYAICLTLSGLQFGLFIGLATGILLFIPYVGFLLGMITGVLVAFFQFGDMLHVGIITAIFIVGQVLEGVFVSPNLIGNKVGLHPVWIIFGLLAGGAMFGFLGVLLAIPVTAVIGVLSRFFISQYLKSPVYLGKKG